MRQVWRSPAGLAAGGIVVTMVVWRAVLLAGSYFNQDDYFMSSRAADASFTWDYLFTPVAGHVTPAQQAAYWVAAHWFPFDWTAVVVFVLALQTLATVLMWHVLTRLLPDRWVRVPLLAAFAWSPLTLATTLWWSAAMGLWPHLVLVLLALLLFLRARQGSTRPALELTGVVVVCLVALTWHERCVLIPPVLYGVAVALEEVRGPRRLLAAGRRHLWLWTALSVLLAVYAVLHASVTAVDDRGNSLRGYLAVSGSYLAENVGPGLAAGPWRATIEGGAVLPPTWVVVVSGALVLLAVAALLGFGGPGRFVAFALFLGYVAADLGMLLYGRGSFGRVIGLDPRYSSDVVHIAVLCAALALVGSPVRFRIRPRGRVTWRRLRTVAVAGSVAAYAVGSAFGSAALVPQFQNKEDRTYLTNLRADLAFDPDQVLLDEPVPPEIVLPLVEEDARLSRVLAPLPEKPVFDQPTPRLRRVQEDGHLTTVELEGPVSAASGPDLECGHAADAAGTTITFPLALVGDVVLHVFYFSGEEVTVTFANRGWSVDFLARRGPNEMWLVMPDQGDPVTELEASVDGAGTVCVTDVEAGWPAAQ